MLTEDDGLSEDRVDVGEVFDDILSGQVLGRDFPSVERGGGEGGVQFRVGAGNVKKLSDGSDITIDGNTSQPLSYDRTGART